MTSTKSIPPYWENLYNEISRHDPTPLALQRVYFFFTCALLAMTLFSGTLTVDVLGVDGSFDEIHLRTNSAEFESTYSISPLRFVSKFFALMELTTGLSTASIYLCGYVSAALYGSLVWTDVAAYRLRQPFPWPKSWETDNVACYDEMFAEPSRRGRLIRRPGNALSNILYLFCSILVLSSVYARRAKAKSLGDVKDPSLTAYMVADATFGAMLLILCIASTIWHGCNALWSHSVDLWSMEAAICFIPMRISSLGIIVLMKNRNVGLDSAFATSSNVCATFYFLHIVSNGMRWYRRHKEKWSHDGCPFSTRSRLAMTPSPLGEKKTENGSSSTTRDCSNPVYSESLVTNVVAKFGAKCSASYGPIYLWEVFIFALMPVISLCPTWFSMKLVFHTSGSVCAGHLANLSLFIGWTYRLLERWALDGCAPLKYCAKKIEAYDKKDDDGKPNDRISLIPRFVWVSGAAIFSPTAVLHVFTGITLVAAFVHARSMDIALAEMMTA